MKFTRMFILKALNHQDKLPENNNLANEDPVKIMKSMLISNSNIDFLICFILALLLIITSNTTDKNFCLLNPINFYLIAYLHFNLIIVFFTMEYICFLLTNPTPSLKPKPIPIQSEYTNNAESNYLSNLITKSSVHSFSFKIPKIVFRYWHVFNSLFHLIQNILFVLSFGLSICFWLLYTGQKPQMNKDAYYSIHLIVIELYEFYSLFRFCFFMVKAIINFLLTPLFVSSIFLGLVEDEFNFELNTLVNTIEYAGRLSLIRSSKGRKSENDEYCSICLNAFQLGDIVSTLPCNKRHTFHTFCLEKWFYNTVSCPLCRSNFSDKIEQLVPISNNNNNNNPFQAQEVDGNLINNMI